MEAPITRTCKRAGPTALSTALALVLAAAPAQASTDTPQAGAFLQARIVSGAGADERAGRHFRALLAADPASRVLARRALDHGLTAGDWPLALLAARRLDAAGALPPLRRMLLVGEALRSRDWAAAEGQIARVQQEDVFATLTPVLRAWRAFGMRQGDPLALLAPMETGPMAGYAVEHRALLELAQGRGDGAIFAGLDATGGLRPQRLRIAAAAELAARGQRDRALVLVAGDQPAFAATRRLIEAGRPVPARIDTAAEGLAELLARIAIDFGQQQLRGEGVMLARIAQYLAPDSAEPAMVAAELLNDQDPAAALAILARVDPADPFAEAGRNLRVGLLTRSGQAERALGEARVRVDRGSRDPADWSGYGDLLLELNRPAEAATAYVRAYDLWRAGSYPAIPEWSLWLSRGGALEQAGQWPAARAALREAHRLAPDQPIVLNYLGYAQLERGENLDEAERLVREANRLAPDSAAITDSLGWALYLRGRIGEAIPLLERAAQGAPGDPEINEHLGDAYYASGRRIEARHAWRAALVQAETADAARIQTKIERGLPARVAQR